MKNLSKLQKKYISLRLTEATQSLIQKGLLTLEQAERFRVLGAQSLGISREVSHVV